MIKPFRLKNTYRDYVWGGKRLRPDAEITAEAWIVYAGNEVSSGDYIGKTLSEVAELEGENFLGATPFAHTGTRFPLLIKLLDCNQWLSLQVHPNDEQAQRLEGAGFFGKTEAWFVVDAEPDAQLMSGFKQGVGQDEIPAAVHAGKDLLDLVGHQKVEAGDAVFISPGTLHALGPGLLIYEVQQTSDITYRVYDWDRPKSDGRKLHLEEAIAVLNANVTGNLNRAKDRAGKQLTRLVSCEYFALELIQGGFGSVPLDTQGQSFALLTVLNGQMIVEGDDWQETLGVFDTLVIPAECGEYQSKPDENSKALLAYVPELSS